MGEKLKKVLQTEKVERVRVGRGNLSGVLF
jgi:hypothetical protein